jgi:hypothetical protein
MEVKAPWREQMEVDSDVKAIARSEFVENQLKHA